jgi:hypothetical protein
MFALRQFLLRRISKMLSTAADLRRLQHHEALHARHGYSGTDSNRIL